MTRRTASLALALATLSIACNKVHTHEKVLVARGLAPGIHEPKKTKPSLETLHDGDVLWLKAPWGNMAWEGAVESQTMKRDGELLQLATAQREGFFFAYRADVTDGTAHAISWLCHSKQPPPVLMGMPCEHLLRRIIIDERTTLGFHPCHNGACPVVWAQGDKATWSTLAGLTSLHLRTLGKRRVLVANRRWVEPRFSGGELVLLAVDQGLAELARITIDHVDRRGDTHIEQRRGELAFFADRIEYTGVLRKVATTENRELESTALREELRCDDGQAISKR